MAAVIPAPYAPRAREPSRFQPPRTTVEMVPRTELLHALMADAAGKITVLTGPPGSGKTSLMQALFQHYQRDGRAVHWLSLGPQDNQPNVLRDHLISAFELPAEGATGELPDMPADSVLLIDGLEHLDNPQAHALAEWFMLSLPSSSCLFTSSTRLRGTLLHGARLRGLVNLVGPRQLKMSSDEAWQLLGRQYSWAEVSWLNGFVDGWAAGLRFLQRSPQACQRLLSSRQVNALPTEMLDYFDLQFSKLPEGTRQILLQLSVFERFTPSLVAAMPEPACAWELVEEQISNGDVLDYVDERREWVAFHPALALYLCDRLRRHDPQRYEALKLFAAERLLASGQVGEAMYHATGLSCAETAARIIEQAGGINVQIGIGPNTTLDHAISPQQAGELPLLFISQLYQRIRHGRFREARQVLDEAWAITEGFTRIEPSADFRVVQAWAYLMDLVLRVSFDHPTFDEHHQRLEADMRHHLEREPVLAASIASVLAYSCTEHGDYEQALRICALGMQAQAVPMENRITFFILLHQASARLAIDSLEQARISGTEALQQACEDGVNDSYEVVAAKMFCGLVHYELNELDSAWQLLQPALKQIRGVNGWMRLYADAFGTAAAIAGMREGIEAAEAIIQEGQRFAAEREYRRLEQWMAVVRLRECCRARLWNRAVECLASPLMTELLEDPGTQCYQWTVKLPALLACAQLHVEMGRPHDCLAVLQRLRDQCPLKLDNRAQLSFELLSMRARFALRRFNAAFESFQNALTLLRGGGYVRLAVESAEHLKALLTWSQRQGRQLGAGLEEWLTSLLQSSAPEEVAAPQRRSTVAANYHLSPRETEIIGLVAEGYINKEIAAMLGISEGTVKSHRKSVHEKLGVNSRSQAISRARELLLI